MAARPVPAIGEKPLLVKSWWESLGNGERLGLLAANPERLGGLDGIPVEVRDRANRTQLATIIDAVDTWGAASAGLTFEQLASHVGERVAAIIRNRVSRDGLTMLRDRIERPSPVAGLEYLLLDFNVLGDGKAVVALGNPDHSDNVAVFVPGGRDGADSRIEVMAADAARRGGGRKTAVVRWLGYDPPDGADPGTVGPRFAEAAAPALDRFVAGLRVTRDGPRTWITMVGHSYGGTVIGVADRERRLVSDAMVFVGVPGVGVAQADKLSIGPDRVWAAAAPGDVDHKTPPGLLGPPPTRDGFGAKPFGCGDTGRLPWWRPTITGARDADKARNGYWSDGNPARDNIAAIVTGDITAVTLRG